MQDQLISVYTISVAIIAPVTGATIWLVARERVRRDIAKEESIAAQVIAKEKSVGVQAIFDLTKQLNKMERDIERLQGSDQAQTNEIHVLEEDYKKLTMMIIELLKLK